MWAIVWPFFLAAWMFLFAGMFSFFLGGKGAETDVGTIRILRRPAQRGLRWVFYLSVGYGGLILVVCSSSWYYWAQLYVRGVPVNATVLNWSPDYDSENNRHFTSVTYEFEAEVDGQRRTFQREGELRGRRFPGYAEVQVLHDPSDPSDSRMVHERSDASDLLLTLASFLVLGVASFLLARRLRDPAAAVSAQPKIPPAGGTAVGRRGV